MQANGLDERTNLLVEEYSTSGRLDNITQVMSIHTQYLESFLRSQFYMLRMDGPLPLPYRHYIAIMVCTNRLCIFSFELDFLIRGKKKKKGRRKNSERRDQCDILSGCEFFWLVFIRMKHALLQGVQWEGWCTSHMPMRMRFYRELLKLYRLTAGHLTISAQQQGEMQRSEVTPNSRWAHGKRILPWGCSDIATRAKRVCVFSKDGHFVWTRLWATWSKCEMRLDQTSSRDAFQPQLDSVLQSNPLTLTREPSLQRRALQYKTWPFATKFIFFVC